ncbi:MAG: chromosome segregation protein SMC [Burkholderiales bacterium]|nr:chromosome segregation protein SMC [Burkholderiales bacterium]
MRLKQINLAGFKSFVDPTHIPVPGQLVGVVGPNGCGKSNIIDAVRWVLGETSAKHLRGATMQDVLFNGSGDRKPVNRASVELVFDNSLGKAAGQWSSYAEISVKRMLERDGDSSYYINNIHVRRRDVADIFLGTGLGARAYAIIEQGMISRVIEAKPEELRVFLEEAAGVSKYRERRRETELRLRDTRENLARVEDIRQELDKQLTHLQGQAEVATRYHALQAEVTGTQQLLWFARRQESAATRGRHARDIERLGNELEAETARLRDAERRLEELRNGHYRAGDEVHAAQGALYETNAEIARLEQQIAHIRENRSRVEQQIGSLGSQLASAESQLEQARGSLAQWQEEQAQAGQRIAGCETRIAEEREKLPLVEEGWRSASLRRDELQQAMGQVERSHQVEQTKLEHAARVLERLAVRNERLYEEQNGLEKPDTGALEALQAQIRAVDAELGARRDALAAKEQALPGLEQELEARSAALDQAVQGITATEARVEALRQLQDKLAHGPDMDDWIAARGMDGAQRLWQGITIEAGYEDALEAVLRERLNAVTLDGLDACGSWDMPPGKLAVAETGGGDGDASAPVPAGAVPLSRFVTCRDARLAPALADWLGGAFVIDSLASGLALRRQLAPGAVLVTRDGRLLTRHTLTYHAPDSELHGVLSRQREIEALDAEVAAKKAALDALQTAVDGQIALISDAKSELAMLRQEVAGLQQKHHALQVEGVRLTEQTQRLTQRGEQIAAELAEIAEQVMTETGQREEASANLLQLGEQASSYAGELDAAQAQFREAQELLDRQREILQRADRELQEAQFQGKTSAAKVEEVGRAIAASGEAIGRLRQALATEQESLSRLDESPWQSQLQISLSLRGTKEQALAEARDVLEATEAQLKEVEQERMAAEQKLEPLRVRISEVKLKEHEARINEEQYAQQLAEAGVDEAALQQQLEEKGVRAGALQSEINRLNGEIKSLGAVNLAALEELEATRERKTYLDAQSEDLTAAMNTLEDAIRRIDRETRERLQSTFDEVNAHFSRMFPALFGGGNARLLLTGEEILDSGIQVIAQPPGKKNSSIHLLSGGEKALTAMALVFSIFQLNPAPFCMLDEVDAPLDDHNTGRFCELVKKMSEQSQFVFISHNKITMEIANQLLGVTMQEPGVSRIVAVDIDAAMKLTEEAA